METSQHGRMYLPWATTYWSLFNETEYDSHNVPVVIAISGETNKCFVFVIAISTPQSREIIDLDYFWDVWQEYTLQ